MIKIAVVEDQKKWSDLIASFLNQYKQETKTSFEVFYFTNGEDFIQNYKKNYDLIFMDVAMPKMNGLETSKALRKIDSEVCLVFLTEMAQYAIEGYEVNAYDFLIKPMEYDFFKIKMNKFVMHIQSISDSYLVINSANTIRKIKLSEIKYIESIKHYVYFHCKDDTVRTRDSLDNIKGKIKKGIFSEINRSLIVNLAFVDNYSNNDVVLDGETLPLSRVYKSSFLNDLIQYFGDKI